jgi:hypothetical protein
MTAKAQRRGGSAKKEGFPSRDLCVSAPLRLTGSSASSVVLLYRLPSISSSSRSAQSYSRNSVTPVATAP